MATLRIGSRGSKLALWQANHVKVLLEERGHQVSIEVIKTTGDKITDVALSKVGTKGMFTKEIEEALADGRVDLAVHSLKDLPTSLAPEFALAAVMERADPRDAFVSHRFEHFHDLPRGAKLGTSSLRRQAQLRGKRLDLRFEPLRGNVDTRLRKLETGELDAIILAAAGLKRLGLMEHVREYFAPEVLCPAAGQGAMAIETRSNDAATRSLIADLDHHHTRRAVTCERSLLEALGGGCQVPIGAFAVSSDSAIQLHAVVAAPDGSVSLCETHSGNDSESLGREVAHTLLGRGAQKILDDVYRTGAAVPEIP
jgi:hydroxymethylbilane synthase